MYNKPYAAVLLMLLATPLWSQQLASSSNSSDDSRMIAPPPVSGAAYPTTTLSEARSNFLRGAVVFTSTYSDNAVTSATGAPVSDLSFSIWPTITLDRTTPRLQTMFTYSPGYTFYRRLDSRDELDQSFTGSMEYRLSPHVTLNLRDSFRESSNYFNQPDAQSLTPVPGSTQGQGALVIAPVADQIHNNGNAELTYQFSANSMVGVSGSFGNLHYPTSSQVPGLYDSNSAGGSFFYNHRVSRRHYLGATYQYDRIVAYPVGAENKTQTHAILGFYTLLITPTLSVSVSGGPQRSQLEESPLPTAHSWSPTESASIGWQGQRTSLAASYSHLVSGGGGLVGAFHSSVANASLRRQLAKTWTAAVSGGYSIYKSVNPAFAIAGISSGGHSVFGTATLQHTLGAHMHFEAGYARLHQNYAGIAVVSAAPDTNREFITISYEFARPIGR